MKTYVTGVNVVVDVLFPGTLRYELQKEVAGGPSFLRTLRAPVTFAQLARFAKSGAAVG